eukprot:g6775.t1
MKEQQAVQDVLYSFLSALQYLHSKVKKHWLSIVLAHFRVFFKQGILHRDIKPENIFVTADNTIKVADFGLSIDEGKERPVTRAGTLDYMPPEVLGCPDKTQPQDNKSNKSLTYNTKADVWGVGVLAYELITGAPPFENESRAATYEEIMFKNPKYPEAMSDSCKEFISKALEKSSAVRPTVQGLLATSWIRKNKRTSADLHTMSSGITTEQDLRVSSKESDHEREKIESGNEDSSVEKQPSRDLVSDSIIEVDSNGQEINIQKQLLPSKPTLKSSTSSSDAESKVSKGPVKFAPQSFQKQSLERNQNLKLIPQSKSEDYVGQFGSIQKLETVLSLNESKLKHAGGSLNLVHKFFSKSEEEKNIDALTSGLNRLPSYSFFPKNNERDFRPAHRLSRELTGTAVSFTKRRTSTKETERTKIQPDTPQLPPIAVSSSKESTKKGKVLSFFKLRKKK